MSKKQEIRQSKPNFVFHSDPSMGERRHTIVGVLDNEILKLGHSCVCHKDVFTKKLGRIIATGRALKHPINVINAKDKDKKQLSKEFVIYAQTFAMNHGDKVYPIKK